MSFEQEIGGCCDEVLQLAEKEKVVFCIDRTTTLFGLGWIDSDILICFSGEIEQFDCIFTSHADSKW